MAVTPVGAWSADHHSIEDSEDVYTIALKAGLVEGNHLLVVCMGKHTDTPPLLSTTDLNWVKANESGNTGVNSSESIVAAFLYTVPATQASTLDIDNAGLNETLAVWQCEFNGVDDAAPFHLNLFGATTVGGTTTVSIPGGTTTVDGSFGIAGLSINSAEQGPYELDTANGWTLQDQHDFTNNNWQNGAVILDKAQVSAAATLAPIIDCSVGTNSIEGAYFQLWLAPSVSGDVNVDVDTAAVTVAANQPSIDMSVDGTDGLFTVTTYPATINYGAPTSDPGITHKVINGTLPLSGSVNITSPGFGNADLAIIILSGTTANDTVQGTSRLGYGVLTSTVQCSLSIVGQHLADPMNSNRSHSNEDVIIAASSAAEQTTDTQVEGSLITDGVNLDVDKDPPASAYNVTVILFRGDGIEKLEAGFWDDLGNTSGAKTITLADATLNPDLGLFWTMGASATPPGSDILGVMSFGASDFTENRACMIVANDGVAVAGNDAASSIVSKVDCIGQVNQWTGYAQNPDVGEFEIFTRQATGADTFFYVVFQLASDVRVAVHDIVIDSATDTVVDVNLTPEFTLAAFIEGPTAYDLILDGGLVAPSVIAFDGTAYGASSMIFPSESSTRGSMFDNAFNITDADLTGKWGNTISFTAPNVTFNTTGARPNADIYGFGVTFGTDFSPPATTASSSGTAANVSEATIVNTGGYIDIDLTNDTFIPAGTGVIGTLAQSNAFVAAMSASASPTNGWNNLIRDVLGNADLTRVSDTKLRLTIPATAAYAPGNTEVITPVVQADILTTSVVDINSSNFIIAVAGSGGKTFAGPLLNDHVGDLVTDLIK